jgi:hypothetical protein
MPDTSIQDELDKVSIEQLHRVVLQLSGNCFELKKLCATVLVSGITIVAAFTAQRLDAAHFVAASVIATFFWFLDAQSYYYQEKLRLRMKQLAEELAQRHDPAMVVDGIGVRLSRKREQRTPRQRAWHAVFNQSMAFYWGMGAVLLLAAMGFAMGVVHSLPPQKAI